MTTPPPSPLHILLVEQDEAIRELISTLLQAHGHTVGTAHDGASALRQVAIQAPQAVFTSLVFSDMDGFALCRRLRALPATSASLIVALTGYSESGIQERVAQAGFDSYMLKPVSVLTLLSSLESFGARHAAAQDSGPPDSLAA